MSRKTSSPWKRCCSVTGWTSLKAQSGPEALELLLAHDDVALALLDVQMPR